MPATPELRERLDRLLVELADLIPGAA
jgi:hypothetical protein